MIKVIEFAALFHQLIGHRHEFTALGLVQLPRRRRLLSGVDKPVIQCPNLRSESRVFDLLSIGRR